MVLGLNMEEDKKCVARFVGTGMHGGVIYTRGNVFKLSEGCKIAKAGKRDLCVIEGLVREYCGYFGNEYARVMGKQFCRITPLSKRPYEKLYSH